MVTAMVLMEEIGSMKLLKNWLNLMDCLKFIP